MALAKRVTLLIAFMTMLFATESVLAQRTIQRVGDFTRSVWTPRDGVPDFIIHIAQTLDGWLWLASRSNLYRFDGVSAERVDVPLGDASTLEAIFGTPSGDLWLGYASGLTLVLPHGDFRHPRKLMGSVPNCVAFLQDAKETMWATSYAGLFHYTTSGWHLIGAESGLPGARIYGFSMDTEGTLWVLSDRGVFSKGADETRYRRRDDVARWLNEFVSQFNNGQRVNFRNVMFFSLDFVILAAGKHVAPTFSSQGDVDLVDTSGGVWVADDNFKIIRAAHPGREVLIKLVRDAMSIGHEDPSVWVKYADIAELAPMEDRQHNIWIVTREGLERFKPNLARTLALPIDDGNYAMTAGEHGTIWFGNAVGATHQWFHADSVADPIQGYDLDTTATFRDGDGSILVGTGEGYLKRFLDGKFQSLNSLPPHAGSGDDVIAIARDGQKRLWVSIRGYAIYRLRDGRWITNGGFAQLPDKGLLRAVADARGRLWLSYPHDLFVIDGEHLTHYGAADGMDITNVRDIVPDGIALIGGDDGFAAFDGQRFHRISTHDASVFTGITGIVRRKDSTIWLNGDGGAARIESDEFARGFKDGNYQVPLRVIGVEDGMPGSAQVRRPLPTLVEGTDGRLWFADKYGIAWLDPSKIPKISSQPSVIIRNIKVGDKAYSPDVVPLLAPGTRNIEIDYTVIGLGNPDQARFRFQLSGVDNNWQNVDARRQAYYTNLGPGSYVFRVDASNEDGVWTKDTAEIRFTIEPEFFQTKWFAVLCALLAAVLLWIAYQYRLRQLMRRLQQRLDERHAERERISRELHDTYLQTVQSLVLKVHGASREMPDGRAKEKITSALDMADEALAEGRHRVAALRATSADNVDLVAALENVANEYDGDTRPSFNVTLTGTPKSVDPLVTDELYACGREAILNAFSHACADTVTVNVEYNKDGLRIEIADNGKGIDAQVIQDGGVRGHWGLRGIRERVGRVGGQCRFLSDSQSGTTVILFVPAPRAYMHRSHIR